jgi:hypothetical protein
VNRINDHSHLRGIVDFALAVAGWYELVKQHWPKLCVHDLFSDQGFDGFANVPLVDTLIVQKTFETSRGLIESSPDTVRAA